MVIHWTKLFKDEKAKAVVTAYATHAISRSEMRRVLRKYATPIDIKAMESVNDFILRRRAVCALNKSGSPITGMRRYVELWP